jgi:hypothetical protein
MELDSAQGTAIVRFMENSHVLEAAGRFHGHIGPWLALGIRAGLAARDVLRTSHFGLVADVHCPEGTPYTCFLDGVQFSSGCTMGKGNIHHHVAEGCSVVFSRAGETDPDSPLALALAPEVWDELHQQPPGTERQVTLLAWAVFERPFGALFRRG